jgi:hypothetical protein
MTAIQFTSPRVGERGRSPSGGVSSALRPRYAAISAAAFALSACAATQQSGAVSSSAPGFLLGLWHGFIFPVAWIVSLFVDKVAVYAVPNNGGWYDFGYFLGIVVFGVGARKTRVIYRDRSNIIDVKAKRVEDVG